MTTETVRQRLIPLRFKRPGANPILIKELRSRMRGPRAFLILTGFLLLLSGIAFLMYKALEQSFRYAYGPAGMSAMVGASMFIGLAFFELFLVAFLTPALTAGTISGEQESLTYEMLVATPLRASSIMFGKLFAALSYIFLLIFAAVPMLSIVIIFGGVTPRDMAVALLVLAVTAVMLGAVGMFWSALLRKTGRATVMSYVTVLSFIILPYILFGIWGILEQQTPPPGLLYPNPFTAMMSVVELGPDQGIPFGGGPFFFLFGLLTGGIAFGRPPVEYNHPAWHWTVGFYILLTIVLMLLTVILVRPAGQRRPSRRQLFASLLLVGLSVVGFTQVFSYADWQQVMESPDEAWQRQQQQFQPVPGIEPAVIEPRLQNDVRLDAVTDGASDEPPGAAPEPTPTPAG